MLEGVDSTRYWLPAAGKGAGKSQSEQVRARAAQTGAAAEAQGGNAGQQRVNAEQQGGNAEQQGGNAGQQRGNADQQGDDFYSWLGDAPAASNPRVPRAQAPPRTGAAQGQAQVLTTWVDLTESDAPHLVESNHQGVFLDPHSCELYTDTTHPYRRWYWHRASGIWAWEPLGNPSS